jgi:hypothetical protein
MDSIIDFLRGKKDSINFSSDEDEIPYKKYQKRQRKNEDINTVFTLKLVQREIRFLRVKHPQILEVSNFRILALVFDKF